MRKRHTHKKNKSHAPLLLSPENTHTQARAHFTRTLLHKNARAREREANESDDERGGAAKRRGDTFVGYDRRQRRYLFQTHFAEIESNRYKILVRRELGDESVD